jgi:pseudouridylate synthase
MQGFLEISQEVKDALNANKPVVALESTIISHGMPYPVNIETALEVEQIIREHGATPATIALHQGKILIGLNAKTLEHFAASDNIIKASRRDIAFILTKKMSASTTVAATMFCAHLANIKIFVTGGIGGVHHHVRDSFDISADLIELANTPVTVVCSGAKSILDLPKTLEVLETQGVAVIGYKTHEFPAFYSHSSGIPLTQYLESIEELADLLKYHYALGLSSGVLIANPIPKSAEIPDEKISPIIDKAQKEAHKVSGKSITPFLLNRISELTEGQSLMANIELIKNNAQLGAKLSRRFNR